MIYYNVKNLSGEVIRPFCSKREALDFCRHYHLDPDDIELKETPKGGARDETST